MRMASKREREEMLNVRMTAEELAMLRALAEGDGLSQSDVVRQFIRRTYRERFGEKKPKKGASR
jgi:hypothetical protein